MNNTNLLPAIIAFAEVAKLGSFTRAAKSLGLSKAAVSLQVKRLEEHLGQELLSRNTRSMSLTTVGKTMFDRSEQLQAQVNLALDELDLVKDKPRGRFAVTFPHTFEADIVLPALKQLCTEYPHLEPYLHVTDENVDLIDRDIDVAIRGGSMKDSSYKAQLIGTAKEVFCASPGYIARAGMPRDLNSLLARCLVAAPWQKNTLQISETEEQKLCAHQVKFVATSNSFSSTLALVKNDMGIALLPEFTLSEELARGNLQELLPGSKGRKWPFYFVHRFSQERPIHIERFYQLIKHYFSKATSR